MTTRRSFWFSLRASFWLIPLVAVVLSVVAAVVLVRVDIQMRDYLRQVWPAFLQTGPEGARQILSAIGSSMITVVGVVFSITMVALSLTANQYSPRVLRNFMRDWLNQTVLGVFAGNFVYTLLVLQAVGTIASDFVPRLAVGFSIALAIASIGFLIAFIHHTARSIQVSEMIARITAETLAAFQAVRHVSEGECVNEDTHKFANHQWLQVPSNKSGYIQDVDVEALYRLACKRQLVVRVECAVGEFVVRGRPLLWISGMGDADEQLMRYLQRVFGISSYRTIEQDPAFGVRQLVDIALRALSPGINDATTAINCIDYLNVILHCSVKSPQAPQVRAQKGVPRLYLRQLTPAHLLDIALNEIRQSTHGNVAVALRLLRLLRQLREAVAEPRLRAHLRHHAKLVRDEAERSAALPADFAEVERAWQKVLAA